MTRLRAAVTIHPAGLGGTPDAGQRASAAVNASCTASSARSMSLNCRTRIAMARPYSSRNTCSIAAVSGLLTTRSHLALERPYLNREAGVVPGKCQDSRQLARPLESSIQVACLQDDKAADVF